jgi:metalloendopeptidase OMA1, mitochondrial
MPQGKTTMSRALLGLILLSGCVKSVASGRPQEIWIDEASELQLGIQACQEALAQSSVPTNPADGEPVRRVGKRLLGVVNKITYKWEFHAILDDSASDAWCLPGGKLAVTTGFYPTLQDEAGLAFVMGHGQSMTRESIGVLTLAPLGGADPAPQLRVLGQYGVSAGGAAAPPFSAEHEVEANRLGLELMGKAGFDPRRGLEVWKGFSQLGATGFGATHPWQGSRLRDLESRMPTALALYDQSLKAPAEKLPAVSGRPGKPGAGPPASPGSIVASAAGYLRTKTKENAHAMVFEFWLNEDVYLERAGIAGPDGLSIPVAARVGIPANLKKQAFVVRPDTGAGDFPGGRYTLTLTGAASGRAFTVDCAFQVH